MSVIALAILCAGILFANRAKFFFVSLLLVLLSVLFLGLVRFQDDPTVLLVGLLLACAGLYFTVSELSHLAIFSLVITCLLVLTGDNTVGNKFLVLALFLFILSELKRYSYD